MKTFKILFAFIATVVLFAACGPDPDKTNAPEITFGSTNPQIIGDETFPYTVNLSVTVKAEGEIKLTTVNRYNDNSIDQTASAKLTKDVNGDNGKTEFTFSIVDKIENNSVDVRYEVIIADKAGKETKKDFTFQMTEIVTKYDVIFTCTEFGTVITINGVDQEIEDAEGVTFKLADGNHTFTATKTGYHMTAPATGAFTVSGATKSIPVTMEADVTTTELGAWTSEIQVGQKDLSWGTIDKTKGQPYGFEYSTNPTTTTARIAAYNSAKFVDVTATGASYTTLEELVAAFTAGTQVDKFDIGFDEGKKAFAEMYFISKVNDNYYLIKTTGAHHLTSGTGNYISFVAKSKKN